MFLLNIELHVFQLSYYLIKFTVSNSSKNMGGYKYLIWATINLF